MSTPLSIKEAIRLIDEVLATVEGTDDDEETRFRVSDFRSMRERLLKFENSQAPVSERQATYIRDVHERVLGVPQYENLFSSGKLCIGRPVETPAVLKNLPKKPPGRASG